MAQVAIGIFQLIGSPMSSIFSTKNVAMFDQLWQMHITYQYQKLNHLVTTCYHTSCMSSPWISFQITFFFSFSRLFLCILQGLSQEVLASWVGWGTHFCEIRASWSFPVSVWNARQVVCLEWNHSYIMVSWYVIHSTLRSITYKVCPKTVINGVNQQPLTSRVLLPQLPKSFGHFLGVNQRKRCITGFLGPPIR